MKPCHPTWLLVWGGVHHGVHASALHGRLQRGLWGWGEDCECVMGMRNPPFCSAADGRGGWNITAPALGYGCLQG